ncbi:MAG: PilN domain-containing protein [Deltaproteobacteria bacterium]|nr:PilN domain-containing protein [Deltaproteobacteria bacterium]MBW1736256.1 PilN domain-containing protein [Deltaproteobacteria bacterium]MBW1908325.1 PilN domain-containing protein [Deltaproteobacteria bacterium]MBW2032594.1 PilN domain-containing protein [Deltaproteobacteria bacterium]MBW2113565.1 PilN domain-containing protein [Deltaproteobacteria bacterium]
MIKINLLPFRAARKKENIRRQISIYVLVVIFILLVTGYYFLTLNRDISRLETEKAQKKKELASYAQTTKKIKALRIKIKKIKGKLNVIQDLEKKKTGPVLLLDEIATAVPRDRVWLSSLSERAGILTLRGTARDNDTVALFMTNLEKKKHINSVDLSSAQLRELKAHQMNVTDFVITCKTYAFKEKVKPKRKRPKKKR